MTIMEGADAVVFFWNGDPTKEQENRDILTELTEHWKGLATKIPAIILVNNKSTVTATSPAVVRQTAEALGLNAIDVLEANAGTGESLLVGLQKVAKRMTRTSST
jgi:signal recognition particle receptor subunit beta